MLDDVGRIEVNLEIGGKAVLLQRGKMIEGQWVRKSNDVIRFVKDNEEIPFYPGTTYFNIVPNQPDFDSHIKVE
ncbi:putative lipoprotein YerB precursor [compost metagenome]